MLDGGAQFEIFPTDVHLSWVDPADPALNMNRFDRRSSES
jgi:hypothetical protein